MRILLSGSSGFIGSALSAFLASRGHEVVPLLRHPAEGGSHAIVWDMERGRLQKELFEGFDAVILLAGEPLMGRWTRVKKQQILRSRVVSVWLLSHVLAQLSRPPAIVISASAVGFYGHRGEELLTEESKEGSGFLATVAAAWERAAQVIQDRGARTLQTRFGLVLGAHGGILPKMCHLARWGFGGAWGRGDQWISWIALSDLVRAMEHLLLTPSLNGAINFVAPEPARQKELMRQVATCVHRPRGLSLPAPLLRFVMGDAANELLLSSIKVHPKRLLESGFRFASPHLHETLRSCLTVGPRM